MTRFQPAGAMSGLAIGLTPSSLTARHSGECWVRSRGVSSIDKPFARARGPLVHSRQASEQHRSGTGRAQKLTSGCAVLGCCTRSAPRSFVGAPELPNERRAAVRGATSTLFTLLRFLTHSESTTSHSTKSISRKSRNRRPVNWPAGVGAPVCSRVT